MPADHAHIGDGIKLSADIDGVVTARAHDVAPPKTTRLVLVFVALALVAPLIGFAIAKLYGPQAEHAAYANLEVIAQLKVGQIENWLGERHGDSEVLASDSTFAAQVGRFVQQERNAELSRLILERFDKLRSSYSYTKIMLLNTTGQLLLSSGEDVTASIVPPGLLRQALTSNRIQRSSIYRDDDGHIHLDWAVPLVVSDAQGKRAVAVVVLRVTAQSFIFPLIYSWPTASASGEILLVRSDGESAVFLNALRHYKSMPMTLKLPMSDPELLAAIAIRANQPGMVRGKDYRGVEVLAAYRPVAGTDWHIVTKIDRDEVLKPMWDMVYWVTLTAFAAAAAIMAALLLLWRQQQRTQRLELRAQSAVVTEESERRFRAIMQSANDAIISADSTGKVVGWNNSAERLFGYTEAEIIGQPITVLMPEHFRNLHSAGLARVVAGGTPHVIGKSVELAGLRKDGSEFSLELSLAQWQAAEGQFFTAIIRDITERKRVEKDLQLFKELLEKSNDAIFINDAETSLILYVNEQALKKLGYTREELLGMRVTDIEATLPGKFSWKKHMTELDAAGFMLIEGRHRRKDGVIFPAEISTRNIQVEGGKFNLAIVRDITERKLVEERIRESEARYRGIFEYSNDIIYLLNMDGTFNSLNPAFGRITGWTAEEWIGKSFAPIVHPDDLSVANTAFQKTLAGESTPTFRLRLARKSGQYFYADLSITPFEHDVIMGIARDVSERQLAEEKIRQLNEELETKVQERTRQLLAAQEELVRKEKLSVLGQVAGSVGHELRNPLGVMSNAVYFLQTVLTDADDSVKEYLNIIRDEIAGSERIVSDLLDSVRTKPPHAEIVGVMELINQTLRKLTLPPSVTVKQDIPETLPPLRVDAQQIHQVFRNLISNGAEAMPEGGVLKIRAVENKQDKNITISVRDNGSGMTPEHLSKLFQPLFTTKARGIGLGLVVVKNLTQANGGSVEVQSEPGKGTTFTVTLPAADERDISI